MKVTPGLTDKYTWRVWFMLFYAFIFLFGVAVIIAGPFITFTLYRLLSTAAIALGLGLVLQQLETVRDDIRTERLRGYLPAETMWLDENEDGQHVAVTRGNGEHLIVTLPSGYHPEQDGGLAIVEQACPNMPKGLRKAWKSAAVEIGLRRLLEDE